MRSVDFTLACGLALVSLACGSPSRKPATVPIKTPAIVPAVPAAAPAGAVAQPAQPEWSYSSVGKRDPFRSFLAEFKTGKELLVTRCSTKLGRYELEQLKLVAVATGLDDPLAMVEAPNGEGLTVRRGACIGKNGGVVIAVRTGEVVVSEWAVRADGTRDKTQTILKLPKEAVLNLEE